MNKDSNHYFRFQRLGGLDQVVLDSDGDVRALKDLDPKLWVALSCPVAGVEIDEATLRLLDIDGDGRVRVPEVLASIEWTGRRLKDLSVIFGHSDSLPLSLIDDGTPEGRAALASARRILEGLGKADSDVITLAEAANTAALFQATVLNGDGVIIPESTGDAELGRLIDEIGATSGTVMDRSDKPGIDADRIETFFDALVAFKTWSAAGDTNEIRALGDNTVRAAAAIAAVRIKIEDWFTRAMLAGFNPKAAAALERAETHFAAMADRDLTIAAPELLTLPVAAISGDPVLSLSRDINPAWAKAMANLKTEAVAIILGADVDDLTEAQWQEICAKVAAYDEWLAAKAGSEVEVLGLDRVNEILKADRRAALETLVAADLALKPEFDAIQDVEQLIRFHRDLGTLLRNFVNFSEFYAPDGQAAFQAGTLFLDGRSTDLCIRVASPNPLAAMSKAYIAYCDCTRVGCAPVKIAACLTQGDSDYMFIGRNGVFYDRKGRDWDAKVTSIIENPISIRQAFWLPYTKLLRWIEETVAKRAAAAEAEADKNLVTAADKVASLDSAKTPPPEQKRVDVGTVAAVGVVITGAISALALILGYVFGMKAWQYPLALVGIVLVISGPSVLIAWLKLRQRNLGPILEGNGWAINGRVKINVPLGSRLTARAVLPKGSKRLLDDPYQDKAAKRRARLFWASVIIGIAVIIQLHATLANAGLYFWQSAPVVMSAPELPVTPTQ